MREEEEDRCANVGNLEDLVKRKKDEGMSREKKEEDIFRECRKTARSPETVRKEEREEELKRWRGEMDEMMKGWKDDVKKTRRE